MANETMKEEQPLDDYLARIRLKNTETVIDTLGLVKTKEGYTFNFFDRPILFDHKNFVDVSGGNLSVSVKTVLCKYLMNSPQSAINASPKLVTLREFTDSGPLFSNFSENTAKTIEHAFSGKRTVLEKKCRQLFGMTVDDPSHDLSVRFKALPRIPIIFRFNDKDESLPATSTLLFHADADRYLDVESLAAIGTYLTGSLIQQGTPEPGKSRQGHVRSGYHENNI